MGLEIVRRNRARKSYAQYQHLLQKMLDLVLVTEAIDVEMQKMP